MEKLTGRDYLTRPAIELMSHPDFSHRAYLIMKEVGKMSNAEIQSINNYIGGKN
jgi:hypothetical protein